MLGKNLYTEEYGEKEIYIFNSRSASIGETLIAQKIAECEEQGMGFEQVITTVAKIYRETKYIFCVRIIRDASQEWAFDWCESFGCIGTEYQAGHGRNERRNYLPDRTGERNEKMRL